ncbi:MAG: hypothetical protein R2856_22060 [Caldilineaceae bacterium]
MGDHRADTAIHKRQQLRRNQIDARRAYHISICNCRNLLHAGNGALRMNESSEAIQNFVAAEAYGADLNNRIAVAIQPGGLQVQSDENTLGHLQPDPF